MAVGAHFRGEGEVVPTKDLPEHLLRLPSRVRQVLVNLRSCASKQQVAEMELRRGWIPDLEVRRHLV